MNTYNDSFAYLMGRVVALLLSLALALALPAGAASIGGISGVWAAQMKTTLKAGGAASRQDNAYGNCTFVLLSSVSGALDCQGLDGAPGHHFTGAVSVVKRGNQLSWSLDQAGIDGISATVSNALARKNTNKADAAPAAISIWIESQIYKPIQISSGQGAPKVAQGTIKGTFIQRVGAKYVAKRFTYSLKLKFLGPAP
jgi:hypothetical protein